MKQPENFISLESLMDSPKRLKELYDIINSHQDKLTKEFGLATISIMLRDFDAALEHMKYVIAKKPNAPVLQRRLAEILILRDEHEEAIPHLEKVVESDPHDSTAPMLLLSTYQRTGNYEKAQKLEDFLTAYKNFLKAID
ncbi:MAG TPA: tetratricopeptide repeat protein [Pyrinomonadaceae bacterium]|jgi:predicted Zn-dependent protease